MGVSNFRKVRRAAGLVKLCLGIIVSLSLALGGIALTPGPVQATGITPAGPVTYNLPVCIPWQQQFTISPTCPPGTVFYWLVGSTPAWVNLDTNTGLLTACPVASSAGTSSSFQVWCTEMAPFPFALALQPPMSLLISWRIPRRVSPLLIRYITPSLGRIFHLP